MRAAQVRDLKGDLLEYPKVVRGLPFWDSANTYFFDNDYAVACPAGYADEAGGKVRAHAHAHASHACACMRGHLTHAHCSTRHALLVAMAD
jgi:hypothetical protein